MTAALQAEFAHDLNNIAHLQARVYVEAQHQLVLTGATTVEERLLASMSLDALSAVSPRGWDMRVKAWRDL